MAAELYRDANLGIRARAEELVVRIREREGQLTEAVWDNVAKDVLARKGDTIEALDLLHAGKDLSFEEVARIEGELSAWVEELDRMIDAMPAMEAEWGICPDDVADPPLPKTAAVLGYPEALAELRTMFESIVHARHPLATFGRTNAASFVARFRERDTPISMRATALWASELGVQEVQMSMQTSVRRSMPRLSLRHETFFITFSKAFGVRQEIEIGEPSFDGLFLIQGDARAAKAFLTPTTRALLLGLARFDVPTLEIDPPARIARISWQFEPHTKAFENALKVLLAVRDLESEVHFLRHV